MPPPFPLVVVHGGAGDFSADDPSSSGGADAPRLVGVRRAAEEALALLQRGGSALDAVERAVRILEDDPTYNAGTGACLNALGQAELDAAIMDGATLGCGAVASVLDVLNPVTLARRVMEKSGHVLLVGPGASAFAREAGIPAIPNARLVTAAQRERFERLRKGPPFGTVGAVARDLAGHLAAANSTGGTALKRPGRVGDTPVLGAGTWADDRTAAVAGTGHGERFIQVGMARLAADLAGGGRSPMDAAREAVRLLAERVQGEGGVIIAGPVGEAGFAHNTPLMTRAWSTPDGRVEAGL